MLSQCACLRLGGTWHTFQSNIIANQSTYSLHLTCENLTVCTTLTRGNALSVFAFHVEQKHEITTEELRGLGFGFQFQLPWMTRTICLRRAHTHTHMHITNLHRSITFHTFLSALITILTRVWVCLRVRWPSLSPDYALLTRCLGGFSAIQALNYCHTVCINILNDKQWRSSPRKLLEHPWRMLIT